MVATIEYFKDHSETNGRGIRVYYKSSKCKTLSVNSSETNFKTFHTLNPSDDSVECLSSLIPMENKECGTSNTLINGSKKCIPSIHNIMLVDKSSTPLLKFYKVLEDEYYLECFGPISSFVGCAFVYSSFVFKWVGNWQRAYLASVNWYFCVFIFYQFSNFHHYDVRKKWNHSGKIE